MMREVFQRRFARALEEDPERTKGEWPDLVLIDGGKGQVSAVSAVFAELGIDDLPYVGVAKGPDRNAGRETFYLPDGREFTLPPNNAVLFHIQQLREEAHRFAIGAHRAKRAKATGSSPLDEVPGTGTPPKRAPPVHFCRARGARIYAAAEQCSAVPYPAAARRGAPLRDRRAPGEARQGDGKFAARRGAGDRAGAQKGAADAFRHRAGGARGEPGGFAEGAGGERGRGAGGV